ncbi:MAG: hypothetical protein CME19_05050 [Gemmatimonadetes bacterium]|nr:hypothetical protein [Gemmatimonadota bacterium]|tara:strand:+ start:3641 stop:3865 length:225 start_codon:yes stop_codon:yes gene_type:complete
MHLSESRPNDQRAFLEAVVPTAWIKSTCPPGDHPAVKKLLARAQWNIKVEHEVRRVLSNVSTATDDTDLMFPYI